MPKASKCSPAPGGPTLRGIRRGGHRESAGQQHHQVAGTTRLPSCQLNTQAKTLPHGETVIAGPEATGGKHRWRKGTLLGLTLTGPAILELHLLTDAADGHKYSRGRGRARAVLGAADAPYAVQKRKPKGMPGRQACRIGGPPRQRLGRDDSGRIQRRPLTGQLLPQVRQPLQGRSISRASKEKMRVGLRCERMLRHDDMLARDALHEARCTVPVGSLHSCTWQGCMQKAHSKHFDAVADRQIPQRDPKLSY